MKKVKVLFIITRSDIIGGASINLLQVSRIVQSLGYDVKVIMGGNGEIGNIFKCSGLDVCIIGSLRREISPLADIVYMWRLFGFVRSWRPRIVHVHSFKASLLSRLVLLLFPRINIIYTAHGWNFSQFVPSRIKRICALIIETVLAYYTDKIICVCKHDLQNAEKLLGFPKARLHLVYNSCMESGSRDTRNKSISDCSQSSTLRLIMVARFEYQKDHITLVEALGMIREDDWVMTFIGSGPLESRIRTKVEELGIQRKVHFLGEKSNIGDYLIDADCFILSSRYEGFPISILEAMSYSLPILATDVGGVKEAVVDGYNGKLFKSGDTCQLASSIKLLMDNPSIARTFGDNSKIFYETAFSEKRLKDNIKVVYSALISK